ncbi:hypothetical protein SAMN05421766_104226 [Zobellia uliginosa]|uniref:Methane oxygenase PmoA n=1 Tax=Zobellia uliginosa TaxID=143224 RepID=A0ABY1KVE3_9FLAO|nr:DUF6786 family protein [Zobellia uliginosa]SIS83063.1 hypothetical protein SAMN05421766_104226 [Zobellia uliginosa]
MNITISQPYLIPLLLIMTMTACKSEKKETQAPKAIDTLAFTPYEDDLSFMKTYTPIIELTDSSGKAKVALAPNLQGRVMTSSSSGPNGRSYGWINRKLFESQDTLEHINAFGGEERFWLGPEGGQYSLFFKEGNEFNLENWQTPRLIDLEPFNIKSSAPNKVVFTKNAALTNYSGFQFDLGIEREITILSPKEIQKELGIGTLGETRAVAYKTTNTVTNTGKEDWKKESGLVSIWLLGMFTPSPKTTIVIPYISGDEDHLGAVVNDTYFGKVPPERLVVRENVLYFSGDGQYRSKIGLPPLRAKNIAGSYDTENGILTILKYNKPEGISDYVNSMWEIQEQPYSGDVINSYNDGAPAPGKAPLGSFYELETSSPALALKAGENGTHIQHTFHIEGNENSLAPIIKQVFGVTIDDIKKAFN